MLALDVHVANAESLRKPSDPKALHHLTRGNELLKAGPGAAKEAADEYKAGVMIEYAAIFDYNLGQCYRLLGEYRTAIWHYERFMRNSPDTPEFVERSRQRIQEMRDELNQKARTTPPTEPAPPSNVSAPTPSTPVRAIPVTTPTKAEHWYEDTFGWGLTASGAVGVAVTGVLFLDASSVREDANHASSQAEKVKLHAHADERQLVGTIIGVGAVAILATGIVKLAIHKNTAGAGRPTWGLSASSDGALVWGRF
ncbi:MAG: hypothetical protein KIT31_16295 [Deltaproteobacteria bacterium]|nr:hypothetical protein [Deltaproteobacteria bacterium]